MPTKKPDPVAPEPTPAERRAQKIARSEARRAARGRYDLSNHPPCGPPGGYTITNVAEGATVEVTDARQA